VHPPLSTSRADFTIVMECTPESGHCHSVCTLWPPPTTQLWVHSSLIFHFWLFFHVGSKQRRGVSRYVYRTGHRIECSYVITRYVPTLHFYSSSHLCERAPYTPCIFKILRNILRRYFLLCLQQ
jgi:hypothetical protein